LILVENEAIDRLYHHFIRLDKDGNGHIDKDEFLSLPAVAENPLAVRFLHLLDVDKGGSIDFNEFVAGMSIFSKKTSQIKKLRCTIVFRMASFF
jgi:serine/threonine-protein phosphatase 2B regulatory subunit